MDYPSSHKMYPRQTEKGVMTDSEHGKSWAFANTLIHIWVPQNELVDQLVA